MSVDQVKIEPGTSNILAEQILTSHISKMKCEIIDKGLPAPLLHTQGQIKSGCEDHVTLKCEWCGRVSHVNFQDPPSIHCHASCHDKYENMKKLILQLAEKDQSLAEKDAEIERLNVLLQNRGQSPEIQ